MLKLVEECAGTGELTARSVARGRVRYRISRYQGMIASGLPVPGLHRIEGTLDLTGVGDVDGLVGAPLALTLEDGRTMALTLADRDGRVLAEGHGPTGCGCC
jgi:hypothetical protein